MTDLHTGARSPSGTGRDVAGQAGEAARQASGQVAGTAREQARHVTGEVSTQARGVASDVRDKVTEQAHTQNDRLAQGIRRMADELQEMASGRGDSPAATVVSRVADSSRRLADHLAQRGPEGVLDEVQDFARRRPGAFLASALVAGFVVGRLGKSVLSGGNGASSGAGGTRQVPERTAGLAGTATAEPPVTTPPPVPGVYPESPAVGGYPQPPATAGYPDPLAGQSSPPQPGPFEGPPR
jgi:uncharacterized protein YjbJ (UPF0337 family)